MINEWLTVRQFSYNTGIAESTIRQRVKGGTISKCHTVSRKVLIHKSELEFIENHMSPQEFADKHGYSVDVIYYHLNNENLASTKRGRLRFIHKNANIKRRVEQRRNSTTLLTPEEYAEKHGCGVDRVYYHLRHGNLDSKRDGRRHLISPNAQIRKKNYVLRKS